MSEIINISGKMLNEYLSVYEILTHKTNYSIPVYFFSDTCDGLDGHWTVSHGLHGGMFSIQHDYDGHYSHKEYSGPEEIPYRLFVEEHVILPEFQSLTMSAEAICTR